ncbi:MAG TPA: N-acetylneuraminate synthase [Gammaproteobacteria bacterium]|nr:N-acetylneuraminate synthase [Gammaproteobacteria bacterium]
MNEFYIGQKRIARDGACYIIAEIGNNHQGDMKTALKMIRVAAGMGVDAVKFQKRDNKTLFTRAMYNKPYDNENSYGPTYGAHRDYLEFDWDQYLELKACARENDVDFIVTPFDFPSVDFLAEVGVDAYKIASADITNTPLLEYVAKLGKPMFVSTGAAELHEIELAYQAVIPHNEQLCMLHCTAGYPTEYENLNLAAIKTLALQFPKAVIGYSGHDYGILAPSVAYLLGATVVEKHFTLNRSWKGTDHKFSLEPTGLHKMVRDLRRIDVSLGDGKKELADFEKDARRKMGKSLYAARHLKAGEVLRREDLVVKSPGGGLPPYRMGELLGKRLVVDVPQEVPFSMDHVEDSAGRREAG